MSLATSAIETKLLAGLSLALALSLGANVLQLRAAWVGQGRAEGKAERDQLAAKVDGLTRTNAVNEALAKRADADNLGLLNDLSAIVERGRVTRVVYRTKAAATPLAANCAPGQDRVDAENQILGPLRPEPRR